MNVFRIELFHQIDNMSWKKKYKMDRQNGHMFMKENINVQQNTFSIKLRQFFFVCFFLLLYKSFYKNVLKWWQFQYKFSFFFFCFHDNAPNHSPLWNTDIKQTNQACFMISGSTICTKQLTSKKHDKKYQVKCIKLE